MRYRLWLVRYHAKRFAAKWRYWRLRREQVAAYRRKGYEEERNK